MSLFEKLWSNHPTRTGNDEPCSKNGKPNYENQRAIRMGVCLVKSGIAPARTPGVLHCSYKVAEGHVLQAENLARGLTKIAIPGVQKMRKVHPKTFAKTLSGQTGIIFFRDYWRRKREKSRNRSGDHIDLWNGSRLTAKTFWLRIQLGLSWEGVWTDFKDSKEIWFWPVK